MAQKISKSAGWRFQAKKSSGLIIYSGGDPESFHSQTLKELTSQIEELEAEDFSVYLRVVPPIEQLIQQVPFSLPLLEAIYSKCELWRSDEYTTFPPSQLHCEQLFCQLVWWTAYCEQNNHNATLNKRIPMFQDLESTVSTIIRVLARNCPNLVERARADRLQLSCCLESLGCHGLVNCSSGLIRMSDAVYIEVLRHADKLKSISARVRDLSEGKDGKNHGVVDPSTASHQRQMSLRLSEVFARLQLNETIEATVEEAMNNTHLTSLLRIVRKRVASDRLLIGLFNAFTRAAPDDFSFEQLDPVLAKLIVVFNNAYEKLLVFAPTVECDSGCSADSSLGGGTSCATNSPLKRGFNSSQEINLDNYSGSPHPHTSYLIRRFRARNPSHHSSLKDISFNDENSMKSSKSLSNLTGAERVSLEAEEKNVHVRRANEDLEEPRQDIVDMKLQIDHLETELYQARTKIAELRPCPEPDYPEASSYYNYSSAEETDKTLKKFSDLYLRAKLEVLPAFAKLSGFQGSEELQFKTILSCIVLTYRSVFESVKSRRDRIWDIIREGDLSEIGEETQALDVALYRNMYRRAKSQHGMQNAKQVTSQIWSTLYDFPSLKTCTVFNRFILECCDVAWDLVAGIDGKLPRLRIEYEETVFDESKHSRTPQSNPEEGTIKQFLWPSLVDSTTKQCLFKATVIT